MLAAAAFFALIASLWCWPMFAGRQLTQSHSLYRSVPWRAERPAKLPVPRSAEGDVARQFYPYLQIARRQLAGGHLPLWNPYTYGGMTLEGNMQSALLFPLTWIGLVLPLAFAWGLMIALKLLIAGLGTYALARGIGLRSSGSLLAGVVYMLSAPNVFWIQWPHANVYALLPWLLLTTHRLYRRPGIWRFAAVALVVGLSILGGHPESAALNSLAAGAYLLALTLLDRGSVRSLVRRARALGWWLGAHLVGLGLSGAAVLPFLEAFRESISRETHGLQSGPGLPPSSGILYALPNLYGDGRPNVYGPLSLSTYSRVVVYVGVVALLLGLVGLVRERRRPVTQALAAAAVLSLLFLFGAPPFAWISRHVWPFETIVVGRLYIVVALAVAIGAGAGVASLERRPLAPRAVILWTGGLCAAVLSWLALDRLTHRVSSPGKVQIAALEHFAAVLALGGLCLLLLGRGVQARRSWGVALAVVACVLDLAYMQAFNVWLPRGKAHPVSPPSLNALRKQPRPFRASALSPAGQSDVLPPNTTAAEDVESVEGYDLPESTRWARFAAAALGQRGLTLEHVTTTPVARGASLRALRLVNTRYYLAAPGTPPPDPSFKALYRGPDAVVFDDPAALSRAYVVPAVRAAGDAQALEALSRGALDPRRTALVPPGTRLPPTSPDGRFRAAHTESLAPDELRVRVPRGAGGWLVLANAYAPQWRARLDGRPVKVRPTNYAVMGIPVGPGSHEVIFSVSHASFWAGAAITLFSAAGLGAALLIARRRRQHIQLTPPGTSETSPSGSV